MIVESFGGAFTTRHVADTAPVRGGPRERWAPRGCRLVDDSV